MDRSVQTSVYSLNEATVDNVKRKWSEEKFLLNFCELIHICPKHSPSFLAELIQSYLQRFSFYMNTEPYKFIVSVILKATTTTR